MFNVRALKVDSSLLPLKAERGICSYVKPILSGTHKSKGTGQAPGGINQVLSLSLSVTKSPGLLYLSPSSLLTTLEQEPFGCTQDRLSPLSGEYKKILRLEDLIFAFLRRYNPDQVRGSKTFVFLSASASAPRAFILI
jgi:hypothetical protein